MLTIPDRKASELAKLFIKEIYWVDGLPKNIVSNYDNRLTGEFWHSILRILAIKKKLSTVFHLKTDG